MTPVAISTASAERVACLRSPSSSLVEPETSGVETTERCTLTISR